MLCQYNTHKDCYKCSCFSTFVIYFITPHTYILTPSEHMLTKFGLLNWIFPTTYQSKLLPPLMYEGGWLFSSPEEDGLTEILSQQLRDTETETFFTQSVGTIEVDTVKRRRT